jgi:hypothetical protein
MAWFREVSLYFKACGKKITSMDICLSFAVHKAIVEINVSVHTCPVRELTK